jgi:hypothetical protein
VQKERTWLLRLSDEEISWELISEEFRSKLVLYNIYIKLATRPAVLVTFAVQK